MDADDNLAELFEVHNAREMRRNLRHRNKSIKHRD
jgi:hypothetical protein